VNVNYTLPVANPAEPYVFENMHVIFLVHGTNQDYRGPIYQGMQRELQGEVSGPAVMSVSTDANSKTIKVEETAEFTSTVTNNTDEPLEVTVMRTKNDNPSGWTSQICVGEEPCLDPTADSKTFTIPANGSTDVKLKVFGGSASATSQVTLQFTSGTSTLSENYTTTTSAASSVNNPAVAGRNLSISQVYPNPVNTNARIDYSLANAGDVMIEIYSVDGSRVMTLDEGRRSAGTYSVTFDASNLINGTYTLVLRSGDATTSQVLTVVR
jgi:hypothetical protein